MSTRKWRFPRSVLNVHRCTDVEPGASPTDTMTSVTPLSGSHAAKPTRTSNSSYT